jgi:hypothetical protein
METDGDPITEARTGPRRVWGCAMVVAMLAALVWAPNGPAGADTTAAAASGTPLRPGVSMYPRALRLQHSGAANGRIITSVVTWVDGDDGRGAFNESVDGGATFRSVGSAAPAGSANNGGLCCGSLYELPAQVGNLPRGTLLWAASVGQNAPNRRMSLQVWQSRDTARTWTYLSSCAVAGNTGGLWEPELAVDAAGRLVCYFADETRSAQHSQTIRRTVSGDGVTWSQPVDVVAASNPALRPGMPVVRRLPDGRYLMAYEICGSGCDVYLRYSPDGSGWGAATSLGTRVVAADGRFFRHAPTISVTGDGRILLVGQMLYNADGSIAAGNGRTLMVNARAGSGAWSVIAAPVSVPGARNDPCPNYSSTLVPSADSSRVLEIATDYADGVCRAFYATGPIA